MTLLSARESNHRWAADQALLHPPPWKTCEAVLSEAFHLLGARGRPALAATIHRGAVVCAFHLDEHADAILRLMDKYADVPMSLADACLVRMTEVLPQAVLLTTDTDFHVYRRQSRQTVPCVMPPKS